MSSADRDIQRLRKNEFYYLEVRSSKKKYVRLDASQFSRRKINSPENITKKNLFIYIHYLTPIRLSEFMKMVFNELVQWFTGSVVHWFTTCDP